MSVKLLRQNLFNKKAHGQPKRGNTMRHTRIKHIAHTMFPQQKTGTANPFTDPTKLKSNRQWLEDMSLFIKNKIMPPTKICEKPTPGLAPSVIKMSSALAGKPSRAKIPAAIDSRKPLIPCQQRKGNSDFFR